jgi:hypothetical protein
MMNPAQLTADAVGNGWFPRLTDKDVWAVNERFKQIMRDEANTLGAAVIILPNSAFTSADFADRGHFTIQGSDKFARLLSEDVQKECR